jgi:regulator of sirC expression with transglutaminase-like and TPR domain
MAKEILRDLPKGADDEKRIAALNHYLFKERGYHGSRHDYYSRNNSYLNEVMDDREGLPITLSVLYLELARRLDLKIVGVPLPGHFVVRHEPKDLPPYLIDVFEGGRSMTNREADERIVKATGQLPRRKDYQAAAKKAILVRIVHNLLNLADSEKDRSGMLRYLDAILVLEPSAHEERWARAVLRLQAGRSSEAIRDCDHLLDNAHEDEVDLDRVRELKRLLQKRT